MFKIGQVIREEGVEYRIGRSRQKYTCFRCKGNIGKGEVYVRWVFGSWIYNAEPLCFECFLKIVEEFHPHLLKPAE